MPFNINDFQSKVASGVRPNLFKVRFDFNGIPGLAIGNDLLEKTQYLCKSAALPSSSMGTIEVPFRGRNLKIPGDRTFDSWTVTFINDSQFSIRDAFEKWMNAVNNLSANVGILEPNQIFKDIEVFQLSKTGSTLNNTAASSNGDLSSIRNYKLFGAWPSSVSQITLGYDQNDQIEEFDVEFQYQYFNIGDGNNITIK